MPSPSLKKSKLCSCGKSKCGYHWRPSPKKKERKIKLPYPYDGKDPDQLFDLIIFRSWTLGNFDGNIPVDESRKVFKKIKELLTNYK